MAKLITVYWRDIPAQVIARQGRETVKVQLADRFQEAIDRAAMRAGKGSSDAYLEEWRRHAETVRGDLQALVEARVAELEAGIDEARLTALVRARGIADDVGAGS